MNIPKIMRTGIIILLVILLAIIVRYFIIRSLRKPQVPLKTDDLTQQKIEKKDKIVHFEIKGGEESVRFKADKHYVGEDKNYHAEGNVEIVFLKKREGKDVFIYGNEVVYDKDWNHFVLSGQGKVKYEDLVIESVSLNYDNKKELFSTAKGVSFSSEGFSGTAQKLDYLMEQEKLHLQENVHLRLRPNLETSFPLIAQGKRLEYSRKSRQGMMDGGVRLFHGESRATASSLKFDLSEDEDNLRTLVLKGKAKAFIREEENKDISSSRRSSPFAQSTMREVEAEEIEIRAFPFLQKVQALEASGNCSLKFESSSGSFTHILAEYVKFLFDQEGELREFEALKKARMIDQEESSEERRLIEGDSLIIKDKTDVLRVKGKGPYEARVSSSDSEVFAEEISISLDNNNLEVKRGVKVVLNQKKGEKKRIGLFSKESPVLINAKEMRYFDEEKRFLFNGDIKAWQEKRILLADEIVLYEETGKILSTGGVKSIFPHKPKDEEKEERVEISSDKMTYHPEQNLIFYEKRSSLKVKDIDLQAQSVSVYLSEEEGDMEKIVARENVVIFQSLGEGRGEEAIYDPDKESVVLLGNPVLIDKDRGMTRGDKLTFYLADDRILVENKARERSATVIKREK
jgi:lipopolysaccharide transport protein LptA